MSTPGWYPDPGGRPGAYRYWDGQAWSGQTTTRPRPSPGDGRQGSRRGIVLVVVAVVLVLVLAVAGILIARTLTGGARPITDPQPDSTVSAWDDSKPTASPTPTPSPSPSPSGTPSRRQRVDCPSGAPGDVAQHPTDGRVHGGRLSFPVIGSGYGAPRPKPGLTWFYDVAAQSQSTEPGWESWIAVGEVAVQPGFETPADAAESSMQCVVNPSWFSDFESRTDVRNEAYQLGGHQGWIVSSEVRVDKPGLSVEGDLVTIVIIDDGRTDRLSGFVSIVPIGDGPRTRLAEETLAALQVD